MGNNAVTVRVMPESPDIDLEKIKRKIKEKLSEAANIKIEEEEIAFGLKALKVNLAYPEEKETDEIENILNEIEGVSSAKIEDIRRAFG